MQAASCFWQYAKSSRLIGHSSKIAHACSKNFADKVELEVAQCTGSELRRLGERGLAPKVVRVVSAMPRASVGATWESLVRPLRWLRARVFHFLSAEHKEEQAVDQVLQSVECDMEDKPLSSSSHELSELFADWKPCSSLARSTLTRACGRSIALASSTWPRS